MYNFKHDLFTTFTLKTYNGRFIFLLTHDNNDDRIGKYNIDIFEYDIVKSSLDLDVDKPIHSFSVMRLTNTLLKTILDE